LSKNEFQLKIVNWRKYQTRTDIKSMNYFRINKSFFIDPKFVSCNATTKLTWFYLLSVCAEDNSELVRCNTSLASKLIPSKTKLVRDALFKLEELGVLSIVSRPVSVPKVKESKVKESKVKEREVQQAELTLATPPSPQAKKSEVLQGPDLIFQLYNENRGELPEARALNKERRKKAAERWKENPSLEYWLEVCQKMQKSAFLLGNNKRGWRANFDWLLGKDKNGAVNHLKVAEGAYEESQSNVSQMTNPWLVNLVQEERQREAEQTQ